MLTPLLPFFLSRSPRGVCLVAAVFIAFFTPMAACEQPTLLAGLPAFAPFAYYTAERDAPAVPQGVVVELYNILAQELAVNFSIQMTPYARALENLKVGSMDIAILFKNDSLQGYVAYVGPISGSAVIVITAPGQRITQYDDLHQLMRVAVIRQAQYSPRFDQDEGINKFPVANYIQALRMLSRDRVDAVVGSRSGIQHAIDTLGMNDADWAEPYMLARKQWWLHVSKQSQYIDLVPAMQRAVEKLYRPELVYELYRQQSWADSKPNKG